MTTKINTARASHPSRIACVGCRWPAFAAEAANRLTGIKSSPKRCSFLCVPWRESKIRLVTSVDGLVPLNEGDLRGGRNARVSHSRFTAQKNPPAIHPREFAGNRHRCNRCRHARHFTHALEELCGNCHFAAIENWRCFVRKLWRTEFLCGNCRKKRAQFCNCTILVAKMTDAGKDHCQSQSIGGFDHFLVAY
jgi:hypothetical protein